jgi:hypothetical protein
MHEAAHLEYLALAVEVELPRLQLVPHCETAEGAKEKY